MRKLESEKVKLEFFEIVQRSVPMTAELKQDGQDEQDKFFLYSKSLNCLPDLEKK